MNGKDRELWPDAPPALHKQRFSPQNMTAASTFTFAPEIGHAFRVSAAVLHGNAGGIVLAITRPIQLLATASLPKFYVFLEKFPALAALKARGLVNNIALAEVTADSIEVLPANLESLFVAPHEVPAATQICSRCPAPR